MAPIMFVQSSQCLSLKREHPKYIIKVVVITQIFLKLLPFFKRVHTCSTFTLAHIANVTCILKIINIFNLKSQTANFQMVFFVETMETLRQSPLVCNDCIYGVYASSILLESMIELTASEVYYKYM